MSTRIFFMVLTIASAAVLAGGCSSEPSIAANRSSPTSLGSGDRTGRALYARQNASVKTDEGGDIVRIFADE